MPGWLPYLALGLAALGLALLFRWLFSLRRTAKTLAFLAPALVEAPQFFALLDLSGPRSHFLERHGPLLRIDVILRRAETGRLHVLDPESRPVASSRWLRHDDMLRAITSALDHWQLGARPKGGRFHFSFDEDIGEGHAKGGGPVIRTRTALVILRRGEVITAYPLLYPPDLTDAPHPLRPAAQSRLPSTGP